MLTNLKALVVILAMALVIFALAKPYMLRYTDLAAYKRRRNLWFAITILGFTSPSIWLYALIAMPLMYWGAKKDHNPLALYVLLFYAIPNASVQIPTIGIGQLLELNQSRMLSFAILMPLMFRRAPVSGIADDRRLTVMDWSLICLGLLQLALVVPYDTGTTTLRRGAIFFLDTFLMFYVFARLAPKPAVVREVIAFFAFTMFILAASAIFEAGRAWLLYIGIGPVWGAIEPFTAYLMRGSVLRAQASAGHSLAFGYLAAMGLGLWFYMSGRETSKFGRIAIWLVFAAGLFVSGSRGAWVTAMLLSVIYVLLRPNAGRYLMTAVPIVIVAVLIAYNSPLKESVIDKLPIIGNSEQDTVEYRQKIAEVSWQLIKQNPVFGDPFAMRNMQELRQGQGIIDIVNGYVNIALFNGMVGFVFFVTLFIVVTWRCFFCMRRFRSIDTDIAAMGAVLIACLMASLFFIGTAAILPATYWICGLMACYAKLSFAPAVQAQAAPRPGIAAARPLRPSNSFTRRT